MYQRVNVTALTGQSLCIKDGRIYRLRVGVRHCCCECKIITENQIKSTFGKQPSKDSIFQEESRADHFV